jgi:hypothetical protein
MTVAKGEGETAQTIKHAAEAATKTSDAQIRGIRSNSLDGLLRLLKVLFIDCSELFIFIERQEYSTVWTMAVEILVSSKGKAFELWQDILWIKIDSEYVQYHDFLTVATLLNQR